jgi:hypothetical protein
MPSDLLKNDEFQRDLKKVFGDSVENMTVQLMKKLYELWAEGRRPREMTAGMEEKLIQSMGIPEEAMNPLTAPLKEVPSAMRQMEKDLEERRKRQAEDMIAAMAPMVGQMAQKLLDPTKDTQQVGTVKEYLRKVDESYDT